MPVSKVAISLPPELLRLIDAESHHRGITRSEFMRWAVSDFFRRRAERAADADYEEAYRASPEDPTESDAFVTIASAAWATVPWDE